MALGTRMEEGVREESQVVAASNIYWPFNPLRCAPCKVGSHNGALAPDAPTPICRLP